MSWQLASFAVLGLVLLVGFAWYERSRPSSRVVAIVAALAVLAIAGRIAFAPIPNVVATTDIVLITGLVMGAAPGFACGAIAALVSNFWMGQGPWTPWQMAAWGLVGVAGAALGRLAGRDPSRWTLALWGIGAAFGFGAIMDLSLMTSFGGEQTIERYLAIFAASLPFTTAHAVGNAVMALVAGPALVGMLSRFRERFEFTWSATPLAPALAASVPGDGTRATAGRLAALALALTLVITATSGTDRAEAASASAAAGYLKKAQNSDGGWGTEPGRSSNLEMTGWSALGLASAGINPLDVKSGGRSPIDYLRSQASGIDSTGDLARTILALEATGIDPRSFSGRDLVSELANRRRENGSWEGQTNLTAFAVLALKSAGWSAGDLSAPAKWLRSTQNRDGGWGSTAGGPGEPDSTGSALQALAAASSGSSALSKGVEFLRRHQRSDGGFELTSGIGSNSQSTAWAVQGAIAAGSGAGALSRGPGALGYLDARQGGDGHFSYSKSSDQTPVWVTSQTMVAAAGKAYPIAEAPRQATPSGAASGEPKRSSSPNSGSAGPARFGAGGAERGKQRKARRAGSARPNKAATRARSGRSAGPDDAAALVPAPASVQREAAEGGDSRQVLLAGLGALAAGLGAGFVLYRRRLYS